MRSLRLLLIVLLNLAFAGAATASEPQGSRSIVGAAKKFAQAHSSVRTFRIVVERVSGHYARARAWPTHGAVADPVWIFLKNDGGTWRGLVLGTSFSARDYRKFGIPRELHVR